MAVWNRNESSKNVRGLVSWRFASSPGSTCGKDWTFQAFVLKQHQTTLLGHYYHLPDLLPWIAIGLCWICTATCDDWRCLFGVPKRRSQPAIRCTPILLSSLKRSTSRNLCPSPCNTKKLIKNDTKDHKSDFSKIDRKWQKPAKKTKILVLFRSHCVPPRPTCRPGDWPIVQMIHEGTMFDQTPMFDSFWRDLLGYDTMKRQFHYKILQTLMPFRIRDRSITCIMGMMFPHFACMPSQSNHKQAQGLVWIGGDQMVKSSGLTT